jgi:hypothetical protein
MSRCLSQRASVALYCLLFFRVSNIVACVDYLYLCMNKEDGGSHLILPPTSGLQLRSTAQTPFAFVHCLHFFFERGRYSMM